MSRYGDRDRAPEDLTAWLAAGMRRVEAMAWRRWNFSLDDAKRWRSAGVREALTAAQWSIAGVDPDTVGDWFAAKITVGEAIRWHEFGFSLDEAKANLRNGKGPDDAYRNQQRAANMSTSITGMVASRTAKQLSAFVNSGVGHDVLGGYLQAQWTDSEALTWARAGVQAWDARAWQTIGLLPAEAGELAKANQKPAEVMRDWWRAGIPFDEMADWLGAGLTPEEAVAQRESGVTVAQAAALRALRRGGSA